MAQLLYQAKCIGGTEKEISGMRGTALTAAGCTTKGICTTTKLYMAYGKGQDPAIRSRKEQAKEWCRHLERSTWLTRKRIMDVWDGLEGKDKLRCGSRTRAIRRGMPKRTWKQVKGPVAAWRMTLHDLCWKTPTVTTLTYDQGDCHRMSRNSSDGYHEALIMAVEASAYRSIVKAMAKGYDAIGIVNPDLESVRKDIDSSRKKGDFKEAAILGNVVCRGCWHEGRIYEAGLPDADGRCTRCGEAETS